MHFKIFLQRGHFLCLLLTHYTGRDKTFCNKVWTLLHCARQGKLFHICCDFPFYNYSICNFDISCKCSLEVYLSYSLRQGLRYEFLIGFLCNVAFKSLLLSRNGEPCYKFTTPFYALLQRIHDGLKYVTSPSRSYLKVSF